MMPPCPRSRTPGLSRAPGRPRASYRRARSRGDPPERPGNRRSRRRCFARVDALAQRLGDDFPCRRPIHSHQDGAESRAAERANLGTESPDGCVEVPASPKVVVTSTAAPSTLPSVCRHQCRHHARESCDRESRQSTDRSHIGRRHDRVVIVVLDGGSRYAYMSTDATEGCMSDELEQDLENQVRMTARALRPRHERAGLPVDDAGAEGALLRRPLRSRRRLEDARRNP